MAHERRVNRPPALPEEQLNYTVKGWWPEAKSKKSAAHLRAVKITSTQNASPLCISSMINQPSYFKMKGS
jgi:hypothetical protein